MSAVENFRTVILAWQGSNSRTFPWRASNDPYEVLVGEILLQRTRGENVAPVYSEFLRRWPTAGQLSRSRESTVARVIEPLGLRKRAPTLIRLARTLEELGSVPVEPDQLIQLPGVGRYAAHAVPVFAASRRFPLMDWVIARVVRRYFGLPGDQRPNADDELWTLATELVEEGNPRNFWLGVLDFAASVCRPTPRCTECPLASRCEWTKSLIPVAGRH